MPYDTLIKGARIATADRIFVADIAVKDGRIAAIGAGLAGEGSRVIDAKGLTAIPGGVDVHTHLDMPWGDGSTADDFASGTIAAACGGTTSIIDYAAQTRGRSLLDALDRWHEKAAGKAAVDYSFHMSVVDLDEEREREMDRLVKEGITTFKLFTAYPGRLMSDDASIFRALLRTRSNGGMVCIHAENGGVIDVLVRKALAGGKTSPRHHPLTRPMSAEAEATHRSIALAEMAGAPVYIVHVTASAALQEVRRARERGQPVFAETCPQYLFLNDEEYGRPGFEGAKVVMSPPLRPKGNEEALWKGLRRDDLQVVSTDHCSFNFRDKHDGKPFKGLGRKDFSKIPNGAPGVETRLLLLLDGVRKGKLTLSRFVEVACTAPARLFGLYPRKGVLEPGADADLVLIDFNGKTTLSARSLHMNVDYNPYEGKTVAARIRDVFSRGIRLVEEGRFIGTTTHGRFLKRLPCRPPA